MSHKKLLIYGQDSLGVHVAYEDGGEHIATFDDEADAKIFVSILNHNVELIAALKAAENHLSELAVMCRDATLYKWNSAGTVQTIHEMRELLDEIESEAEKPT